MLEQHLRSGGSALVLLFPTADTMDQAISSMGIHARTDQLIVHESLAAPERQSNDFAESAFAVQPGGLSPEPIWRSSDRIAAGGIGFSAGGIFAHFRRA